MNTLRYYALPASMALALGMLAVCTLPSEADTAAITSVNPAATNAGYEAGMAFTVSNPITVTQLGDYIVAGNANNTQGTAQNVGIYDFGPASAAGNQFGTATNINTFAATLLTQANVPNITVDANGFSYAALPVASQITLTPGELYGTLATTQGKVWELNGTNVYDSEITYYSGFANRTGSGTLPATIQHSVDGTTSFLDNAKQGQYIGGTFQFIPVAPAPEPSQNAALALGALGLGGLIFAAHRRSRANA